MGAIIFIIIGIVAAGIAFIYLQQLPPLPADMVSSISWVVALPWGMNAIFPVDTLFVVLTLILGIELVLIKLGLISWSLSKVGMAAPSAGPVAGE
jgi:hypothetical protein